jgi:hypothetical protein
VRKAKDAIKGKESKVTPQASLDPQLLVLMFTPRFFCFLHTLQTKYEKIQRGQK